MSEQRYLLVVQIPNWGGGELELPPNDEIWYISTDNNTVAPNNANAFGAKIVSNTYSNGKGIIKFNGNVTKMSWYAFQDCSTLKSVSIPQTVTSFSEGTFTNCTNLSYITIPETVQSIGSDSFDGTPWLENKDDGVIYINKLLYSYKGMLAESVIVKEGTTRIENSAFYQKNIASLTIPNSVTSIGSWVCGGCNNIETITIIDGNTKYDSRNNCNGIIETESNTLIQGCKSTKIPNDIYIIGYGAFQEITALNSITIPNNITKLNGYCFAETGLTTITIPNSVTNIAMNAFDSCKNLQSFKIECETPFSINKSVFNNCTALTEILVPSASVDAYKAASGWSTYASKIKGF